MFVSHQISDKRNGFPLAKVRHAVDTVECTSHSEEEKFNYYTFMKICYNYPLVKLSHCETCFVTMGADVIVSNAAPVKDFAQEFNYADSNSGNGSPHTWV